MKENKNDNADEVPDYLTGLADRLAETSGVDADLADILAKHILVETPTETCVADAKAAIAALALQRASPAAEDTQEEGK